MIFSYNNLKQLFVVVIPLTFLLFACGSGNVSDNTLPTPLPDAATDTTVIAEDGNTQQPQQSDASNSDAYPGVNLLPENSYPVPTPDGLVSEPPNTPRDLPQPSGENAVIGGILIREIVDTGFIPLQPRTLSLAEVLHTDAGNPAYIREGTHSPQAELFPTGIFLFRDVPPGEYGLMVDVGFTKFPITSDDGTPLILNIVGGQVLDLGQVITVIPGV